MAAPMPAATPVKCLPFKCFVCRSTTATTTFTLNGRKCKSVDFIEKVKDLIGAKNEALFSKFQSLVEVEAGSYVHDDVDNVQGDSVLAPTKAPTPSVCRSCFGKLLSAHELCQLLAANVADYNQGILASRKRMARLSPSPLKASASLASRPTRRGDVPPEPEETPVAFPRPGRPRKIPARKLVLSSTSTAEPDDVHEHHVQPVGCASDVTSTPVVDHSYASANTAKERHSDIDRQKEGLQRKLDSAGLHGNPAYVQSKAASVDHRTLEDLIAALQVGNLVGFQNIMARNKVFMDMVHGMVLREIDQQSSDMQSRNVLISSLLKKKYQIAAIHKEADHIVYDMLEEMHARIPFLLDLIVTFMSGGKKKLTVKGHAGPMSSIYGILMSERNHSMFAWRRLMSVVGIRAHIEDTGMTRFNHMGITQSRTSKLRILQEAAEETEKAIIEELRCNPVVKLTGDNLDFRVQTAHQSSERHHQSLHYFVTNMIFSRVATPDLSVTPPTVDASSVTPATLLLHGPHEARLKHCYMILLARIVSDIPAFQWMKSVIPDHIEHPHAAKMAKKSKVLPLPVQFKNESKHSEVMDILDTYEEQLIKYFTEATGSADILHQLSVPVGGDQLTRIRFHEVKELRALSPTPVKRFSDLHPFIIELWHLKQDFMEKCYKLLFKKTSLRQPGTLYFFKSRLMRTDVNGNVKSAMKAHHQLLTDVGKELIREQALEYFGCETDETSPTLNEPAENISEMDSVQKYNEMEVILTKFMDHFGYGYFSLDDFVAKPPLPLADPAVTTFELRPDGTVVMHEQPSAAPLPDALMNYSTNLCHWVLHILELDDTAHEGDFTRSVPNCMYSMPFFYSHSRLSKYFIECMDFILKVERTLSPLHRTMVLEGSFVNVHGGRGKNVEADLRQEHSVRNQKDAIKHLGANKTEKAISRAGRAADTINDIVDKLDSSLNLHAVSGKHTKFKSEKDVDIIRKCLREQRPFRYTPGRECLGFDDVKRSPFLKINLEDMSARMAHIISRLLGGELPVAEQVEEISDED